MGPLVSATQEGGGREEARGIRGRDVQVWQVQIHEDHIRGKADTLSRRAHDLVHHLQDVWHCDEALKKRHGRYLECVVSVVKTFPSSVESTSVAVITFITSVA